MKHMQGKDRDLDALEFLQLLQFEYFQCDVRRKIHPSIKDKKYYSRVMEGKKEKIEDIAQRNGVATIFDSDEIKRTYYDLVYRNGEDLPNIDFSAEELEHYYSVGCSFKSKTFPTIMGKCDFVGEKIIVVETIQGKKKTIQKHDAIRIL